jgi:hypothetical protein
MKNKLLKLGVVFGIVYAFIILMANLVAATESLVIEKDFPISWTTEPNDYIRYKQTAVDDECVIVVPQGGTSAVTKGCNTYTAMYSLSGPVQPSVPFYQDGIEEISVTVETHSFLFDQSDFQSGFAEVIKNDFNLRGLEITEEFESNYYIIWGAYPNSNIRDAAIGWLSGDKVIVIILSKWDESRVDDDIFNDLTKEYFGRYPVLEAPEIVEVVECRDSDGGLDYYKKGTVSGRWAYNNQPSDGENDYCAFSEKENKVASCEGTRCYLIEFYCTGDIHFGNTPYTCPYGCKDGACLEAPTIVEEVEGQIRCDIKDAIAEGETKTYTIAGRDYEIEVSWIGIEVGSKENKAKFKINGEVTNTLAEGEIYNLIDGSRIQSLDITLNEAGETSADKVTFCFQGAVAPVIEEPEQVTITEPVTLPADLRYYPKFLIKDEKLNALIVVGDTAPANDVISSIDIATGIKNYAEIGTTKLVSEITKNNNLIVVGNEAIEKLDMDLLGLEQVNEGEGLIQLVKKGDYAYLIVGGYTDIETRSAAKVLSRWQNYELKGDRVKVLLDKMGNPVLSYPPYETVEEPVVVVRQTIVEVPEVVEVKIPTCDDGIKNDGETGIDCGGPCKPCTATSCNTGCLGDSTCLPFGTRMVSEKGVPMFCDLNQEFNPQKQESQTCQNSYECLSNSCHNGKCIDLEREIVETRGILEKILNWLTSFFS